ncbi:hypothetical protein [Parvibaculum sp.]|uniref:hypothetical protein n=1 Tax=Parvibaculum sp. TaxID=2024848 RepID=UPI002730FEDC|nr:hypothetical protein [Parvibaculum sp.]MDP1626568.1 hypothetical protein [Parvibaculum sp.]MDP2150490.1 hypothetical protein [Parvibaculum sp.]MDP3327024.1 hypothetical protein [Parvibaculum sp.]
MIEPSDIFSTFAAQEVLQILPTWDGSRPKRDVTITHGMVGVPFASSQTMRYITGRKVMALSAQ